MRVDTGVSERAWAKRYEVAKRKRQHTEVQPYASSTECKNTFCQMAGKSTLARGVSSHSFWASSSAQRRILSQLLYVSWTWVYPLG